MLSANDALLANRDTLQGIRIDVDSQPRLSQRRGPASPAKGNILSTQGIADKVSVVGTFKILEAGHGRCEMPSCRGKKRRLAHEATELTADAILPRVLQQTQRRNVASAFGEPDVEQVAQTLFLGADGIDHAAHGFIEHDGHPDVSAHGFKIAGVLMRHWLLDGRDAE